MKTYSDTLGVVFDAAAITALGLSVYGALVSDVWLASTQWLLVSVWFLVLSGRIKD